jgi:hypothetical protein
MGRCIPVPVPGMVCKGQGTVWENPTRGLPVVNPIADIVIAQPPVGDHLMIITLLEHSLSVSESLLAPIDMVISGEIRTCRP